MKTHRRAVGFIFAPQKELDYVASDFGLNYREVYLNTPGRVKLHGWYFNPLPDRPVILFCHGNAAISLTDLNITVCCWSWGLISLSLITGDTAIAAGGRLKGEIYTDAPVRYARFLLTAKGFKPGWILSSLAVHWCGSRTEVGYK
jgi:hypothetical protein